MQRHWIHYAPRADTLCVSWDVEDLAPVDRTQSDAICNYTRYIMRSIRICSVHHVVTMAAGPLLSNVPKMHGAMHKQHIAREKKMKNVLTDLESLMYCREMARISFRLSQNVDFQLYQYFTNYTPLPSGQQSCLRSGGNPTCFGEDFVQNASTKANSLVAAGCWRTQSRMKRWGMPLSHYGPQSGMHR